VTTRTRSPAAGWLPAVLADLVCVLVFAAAGKTSHESGESAWVVLAIVWPYALSVATAHACLNLAGRRTGRTWPEGVLVLAVTVVLGTMLRVVSGRGIAATFLLVTVLFLALTMLGWRSGVRLVAGRRDSRAPT
jgi:hypothetical protein